MKTALVTGAGGMDGALLCRLLLEKGYVVYGLCRRSSAGNTWRIEELLGREHPFHLIEGDITDPWCIQTVLRDVYPHEIYNLAAQSHVGTSFTHPAATFEVDTLGVLHLLEGMKRVCPHARLYQASTSEMFGSQYSTEMVPYHAVWLELQHPERLLNPDLSPFHAREYRFQDEQTAMVPNSPYAVAKLAAHHLCGLYRKSYGLHISCGILFNHEHAPFRPRQFVTRKITSYVARLKFAMEKGRPLPGPLDLGNLEAQRDWGYAPEYVEGMWRMLQQSVPDDYVLATGETHTVREFLLAAWAAAGLPDNEALLCVRSDPGELRPCEVPYLRGRATKAAHKLGWNPATTFEGLVQKMVEADLELLR